jgi:hypothetical protein
MTARQPASQQADRKAKNILNLFPAYLQVQDDYQRMIAKEATVFRHSDAGESRRGNSNKNRHSGPRFRGDKLPPESLRC